MLKKTLSFKMLEVFTGLDIPCSRSLSSANGGIAMFS